MTRRRNEKMEAIGSCFTSSTEGSKTRDTLNFLVFGSKVFARSTEGSLILLDFTF